ncbi:MAG: hypothetical protein WBD31_30840 [Rubripirellula sp.]
MLASNRVCQNSQPSNNVWTSGLTQAHFIHVTHSDLDQSVRQLLRGFARPETPMKFILQPWQLMLIILGS